MHQGARANTCLLGQVPTAPAGTQHTTSTAHAPHGACATRLANHSAGASHRRCTTAPERHTTGAPHHRRSAPPARQTAGAPHRRRATQLGRHTAGFQHRPRVCEPTLPPVRQSTCVHFFLSTRAPVRRFTSHLQSLSGARPRRSEPAQPGGCVFLRCDHRAVCFMHTLAAPRPRLLTYCLHPTLCPCSASSFGCLPTTLPSLLVFVFCSAALFLFSRSFIVSQASRARCTSVLRLQPHLSSV